MSTRDPGWYVIPAASLDRETRSRDKASASGTTNPGARPPRQVGDSVHLRSTWAEHESLGHAP
jgi:hypothetical protein